MKTAHLSIFGLKKKTWGTLLVMTSIGFNAFAGVMYTNNYIQTHDFRTPVLIKFEVHTQSPVTEKKQKLIKPISFIQSAHAQELPSYLDSDNYKNSNPTWKAFVKSAYRLAPIYDYPVSVLLSQADHESQHGTSHFAVQRNNFFGMNCNDHREEEDCTWYSTPDESIVDYMHLIKRGERYYTAYQARSNPDDMISLIWQAGYATDERYVAKVMAMPEWGTK